MDLYYKIDGQESNCNFNLNYLFLIWTRVPQIQNFYSDNFHLEI